MKNKKNSGVTLVELMVVVALMAIIFIPLVQIFKSFMNAWWAGKARMTVQAEARDAMYWFVKDMKSAYRHSIGNLVTNGRFDSPGSLTTNPDNWGALTGGITVLNSTSTRGMCIGISQGAAITYSSILPFQLENGVRYILTGKIRNTDVPRGKGKIEVTNAAGTTIYASTETDHTSWWETVTAWQTDIAVVGTANNDGTFTMPATDDCLIRLSNINGAVGSTAFFDDISVTPKKASLVYTGSPTNQEWQIPHTGEIGAGRGYTFLVHPTGSDSPIFMRYRIEDVSATQLRIWRQKGSEVNPATGWTSIDYNHIAEYCSRLDFEFNVPDELLRQNGTDNGISINLEFERSAGGASEQPYSMKTYVYPASP